MLVGWVLLHINLCRLFNAKSIFKQIIGSISSLAQVHSLIVKTFQIQAIQFSQTVVIKLIQFSISIDFLYT